MKIDNENMTKINNDLHEQFGDRVKFFRMIEMDEYLYKLWFQEDNPATDTINKASEIVNLHVPITFYLKDAWVE